MPTSNRRNHQHVKKVLTEAEFQEYIRIAESGTERIRDSKGIRVTAVLGCAAAVLFGGEDLMVPMLFCTYIMALFVWTFETEIYPDTAAWRYLKRVGYSPRRRTATPAPVKSSSGYSSGDDDDRPNPYWATGTYDPDRYYGAVREYGYSHMNYIRDSYGDLDTYEANRPD